MTTIAQIDQLITSLQGMKASFAQSSTTSDGGDFNSVFASALSDAEAAIDEMAPMVSAGNSASLVAAQTSSFDTYRAMDLLTDNTETSCAARPNMQEFMNATGASTSDSSELLYGVIGSNADYRDWSAIMASDNPVDAARAATAQLYGSDVDYQMRSDASYGTPQFAATLVASSLADATTSGKTDNFALHAAEDTSSLMAVSSSGLMLRGAGSSQEQIERTAWLFGFSTEGLGALASKAETTALKDALESFA